MKKLDEWCFEFSLFTGQDNSTDSPESLLDKAIEWAEERDWGVGGGYSPKKNTDETQWFFRFGLCINISEQLISEASALNLLSELRKFSVTKGWRLKGGFRPFTKDESNLPDDWSDKLEEILDQEPVDWNAIYRLFNLDDTS
jgi:hypothetical protein